MKLTHNMLTEDVLMKFENIIRRKDFTEDEKKSFEHLAFCSCMGGRTPSEQWERFCELVNHYHGIDLANMRNSTVEYLKDFTLMCCGLNKYNKDFDPNEIDRNVNLYVWCHSDDKGNDQGISVTVIDAVSKHREFTEQMTVKQQN